MASVFHFLRMSVRVILKQNSAHIALWIFANPLWIVITHVENTKVVFYNFFEIAIQKFHRRLLQADFVRPLLGLFSISAFNPYERKAI